MANIPISKIKEQGILENDRKSSTNILIRKLDDHGILMKFYRTTNNLIRKLDDHGILMKL